MDATSDPQGEIEDKAQSSRDRWCRTEDMDRPAVWAVGARAAAH